MSDYREHKTKTNLVYLDPLPGYWGMQDRARGARRHFKRVMRRNRRRAEARVIDGELAELFSFDDSSVVNSYAAACHCADCMAGVTE